MIFGVRDERGDKERQSRAVKCEVLVREVRTEDLPLARVRWRAGQYEGYKNPLAVLPSHDVESKSARLLVEDHLSCFPT